MTTAEHKVRVVTAFRGNKDNDLELQVGDEVTVLLKVRPGWLVVQGSSTPPSLPYWQTLQYCSKLARKPPKHCVSDA